MDNFNTVFLIYRIRGSSSLDLLEINLTNADSYHGIHIYSWNLKAIEYYNVKRLIVS